MLVVFLVFMFSRQSEKNDYIMLIGDMNARVGNNKVTNILGTNGEATLNNISNKLIDFCTCNTLKIMNTFFSA